MPIYINKNGQQSGPYEDHIVIDQLRSGVLSPSDMGIRHGDASWQKLGDMFPGAARASEPSPAVNAAAAAMPQASNVAATPAAASKGGCKNVAAILLMVFGVMALLGGAAVAIGTPFVYSTPSCEFAEGDWKEIEELRKKYEAETDSYEKMSIETELETKMAGYERSAKHCDDQKSTMRMFQIGFGVVGVVGLLMLIIGIIVKRI